MFDVGKWKVKLFRLMDIHRDLTVVVTDNSSKDVLVKHYGARRLIESADYSDISDELRIRIVNSSLEQIESQFSYSLENGLEFLNRQIVVTLPVYIEAIAEEFLEELFEKFPERANIYLSLSDKGNKGFVELSLIAKANNLEELRIQIARNATSQAIRGARERLFQRIEKASKGKLEPIVVEKVLEILKIRNSIIHDAHEPEIKHEKAREYCLSVFELVEELGGLAASNGIVVVDPSRVESS